MARQMPNYRGAFPAQGSRPPNHPGMSQYGPRPLGPSQHGMNQPSVNPFGPDYPAMNQGDMSHPGMTSNVMIHPGMNQRGMGPRGMGPRGMVPLGMGPRGMGPRGMGQHEVIPLGMGHPGMGQREMGHPGMGQREMGHPGMGQREMGHPGMGQREMGHPGMGQREMGHPGMGQRHVNPSDAFLGGSSGAMGHRELSEGFHPRPIGSESYQNVGQHNLQQQGEVMTAQMSQYKVDPRLQKSNVNFPERQQLENDTPWESQIGASAKAYNRTPGIEVTSQVMEPTKSSHSSFTTESASSILASFGLTDEDLNELSSYPDEDLTPENMPYILRNIRMRKTTPRVPSVNTQGSGRTDLFNVYQSKLNDSVFAKKHTQKEDPRLARMSSTSGMSEESSRMLVPTLKQDSVHSSPKSNLPNVKIDNTASVQTGKSSDVYMGKLPKHHVAGVPNVAIGNTQKEYTLNPLNISMDSLLDVLRANPHLQLGNQSNAHMSNPSNDVTRVANTVHMSKLPGAPMSVPPRSVAEPLPGGIAVGPNLEARAAPTKKQSTVQHSELPPNTSQDGLRPGVSQTDHQGKTETPTPSMIHDYNASKPRLFPHMCSLCYVDSQNFTDWINHQNSGTHINNCRIIRERFPSWLLSESGILRKETDKVTVNPPQPSEPDHIPRPFERSRSRSYIHRSRSRSPVRQKESGLTGHNPERYRRSGSRHRVHRSRSRLRSPVHLRQKESVSTVHSPGRYRRSGSRHRVYRSRSRSKSPLHFRKVYGFSPELNRPRCSNSRDSSPRRSRRLRSRSPFVKPSYRRLTRSRSRVTFRTRSPRTRSRSRRRSVSSRRSGNSISRSSTKTDHGDSPPEKTKKYQEKKTKEDAAHGKLSMKKHCLTSTSSKKQGSSSTSSEKVSSRTSSKMPSIDSTSSKKPGVGSSLSNTSDSGTILVKPAVDKSALSKPDSSLSKMPDTGISSEKPSAGSLSAKPGAGISSAKPGAGISSAKPGAGISSAKPGAGISSAKPGAGSSSAKPGAGSSSAKPGPGSSLDKTGTDSALSKIPETGNISQNPDAGFAYDDDSDSDCACEAPDSSEEPSFVYVTEKHDPSSTSSEKLVIDIGPAENPESSSVFFVELEDVGGTLSDNPDCDSMASEASDPDSVLYENPESSSMPSENPDAGRMSSVNTYAGSVCSAKLDPVPKCCEKQDTGSMSSINPTLGSHSSDQPSNATMLAKNSPASEVCETSEHPDPGETHATRKWAYLEMNSEEAVNAAVEKKSETVPLLINKKQVTLFSGGQASNKGDRDAEEVDQVDKDKEPTPSSNQDVSLPIPPGNIDHVWIVGNSFVHWAKLKVIHDTGSSQLGFNMNRVQVSWIGMQGLLWDLLLELLKTRLKKAAPPSVLVLHLGGNDLTGRKAIALIGKMKDDLTTLQCMLPDTHIIWSNIIPRRNWRGATNTLTIEKIRRKVNTAMARFCKDLGWEVIHHEMLLFKNTDLFTADGMNLSDAGNHLFIQALQQALHLKLGVQV